MSNRGGGSCHRSSYTNKQHQGGASHWKQWNSNDNNNPETGNRSNYHNHNHSHNNSNNNNSKDQQNERNNQGGAANSSSNNPCHSVPGGQPLDKWFISKFINNRSSAYNGFMKEFEWLSQKPEASASYPPFIKPKKNCRTIQATAFSVNANYVEGWAGRRYIACEGPNSSSVYDFWEMVWQEGVEGILMLNRPYEERLYPKNYNPNRETIQYWPIVPKETIKFTPYKLTCLSTKLKNCPSFEDNESLTEKSPEAIYRVTNLSLLETNPITNPKPRQIIHICYYRWPDGQIPEPDFNDPSDYQITSLGLTEMLRTELGEMRGPLVVHCHAGVGRTGVVIALDIAMSRLFARQFADVRDTVRKLREQRPKSVMNYWQYVYINLSLASVALSQGWVLPKQVVSNSSHVKKNQKSNQPSFKYLLCQAWQDLCNDFNDISD